MTQSSRNKNPFDTMMSNTEYGDMHRIIVQCIMSAGMLDAKGVKTVFTGALKHCGHEIDEKETIPMNFIQKTIKEINEKINKYDLAIKSVTCEITCKKYYVFIISVEKPIMKMQKVYSPFEVELFQKIMDRILRKYKNFAVSVVECINITHEIEGHGHVSLKTSEAFIEKMLILQYFVKLFRKNKKQDVEYDITLGPRSIREMEPILKDVYQDVLVECLLCKQVMLHGYVCPACDSPIHKACYTRCINSSHLCVNPECNTDWKPETLMKQREKEDGDEPQSEATVTKKSRVAKPFADSLSGDASETENEDGMPRLEPMEIDNRIMDDSNSSEGSTGSGSTDTS